MVNQKKNVKSEFFEVKVPLTSAKIHLYSNGEEALIGKVVKLDLTRSLKGKSLELSLRVKKDDFGLVGEPEQIWLVGSYVRRMMRKGTDYVEDSFEVQCKDGEAQIKPFMIARNKVSRAVRNSLRDTAQKHLIAYMKARTLMEAFSEITANKVQKELSLKLKKIYPLALCEIRAFVVKHEKAIPQAA